MSDDVRKLAKDWTHTAVRDGIQSSAIRALMLNLAVIAEELRRLNDGRDAFQREMAEFFERLTAKEDDDVSLRSGQPAAASGCRVCGKPSAVPECIGGTLTADQWVLHHIDWFNKFEAVKSEPKVSFDAATQEMEEGFGPCPEDSP